MGTAKNGTETKVNIDNNCEGLKENAACSFQAEDFTGLIGHCC